MHTAEAVKARGAQLIVIADKPELAEGYWMRIQLSFQ
jgi:hypothetical protein